MKTLLLTDTEKDINIAAEILKNGGLVGIPTETVYGLAADAFNAEAVKNIFKAKGRPCDNPLIVHVADFADIERLDIVRELPKAVVKLADAFWPGPLTVIMKKSDRVPLVTSGGLDTVAVRFPSHPAAQKIISASGTALAAPSANISGSPSPTTARHVMNDMNGKIDAVLDGGACGVGVESTVITLVPNIPRVLRPGAVTVEMLGNVLGKVDVDDAVLHKLEKGKTAASPGMKYKHYAPRARVVLLKCTNDEYISYVNAHADKNGSVAALCCDEDVPLLNGVPAFSLGRRGDYVMQAHRLFDMLRELDQNADIKTAYSRLPHTDGVGMAVYNRLIRAAGFEVIDLEKN